MASKTSKAKAEQERQEYIEELRRMFPPGSTVYTILRHVSVSGMTRDIDVIAIDDNEPRWLSWRVATVIGASRSPDGNHVRVQGAGMDMGFHVVYSLSRVLYPDGFGCIGDHCPSNDHSNGDRSYAMHGALLGKPASVGGMIPDELSHWHRDGGYALRHRWI